ncbi:MAG TPA: NF038122 family metalloprotease, partial [Verrucomicrobiae bacterium]|nr:NF038122 family metalloprotease [Verrucomicrobiae bacterium]
VPAGLDATLSASPDPAPLGGNVTVTLTLSNSSAATGLPVTFTNVAPNGPPTFDGAGALQYLNGPSPSSYASLPAGSVASFTYTFQATTEGHVRLFGIGHGFSGGFFPSDYASAALDIKPFVVTGQVLCSCDTNPIPGATIQIGTNLLTSDLLGSYSCSNVIPGNYAVTVQAPNFFPLTSQITVLDTPPIQTNDLYLTNSTFLINPTIDGSITALANGLEISNAIVAATKIYSQYIADPLCVKIRFYKAPSGLGESYTFAMQVPYSQYYADLHAVTNLSALDVTALQTLHAPPDTGVFGNAGVWITAATLDAIGEHLLADSARAHNDGFNSQIGFNLDEMNISRPGFDPSKYDFPSTAWHEINEALGIGGAGSSLRLSGTYSGQTPPTNGIRALDLYRYAAPGVHSFSLDTNVSSYFSIDGGNNELVHFNQYGDGSDFGDWGNGIIPAQGRGNTPSQVQDAYGKPGAEPDLGANEWIALDVIGYTLKGTSTLNSASFSNGAFTLNASTVPGQTYQLQATATLTPPQWHNVGSSFVASSMTASAQDPAPTGAGEFYRLVSVRATNAPSGPSPIVHITSFSGLSPRYQLLTNVFLPQH